MFCPVPKLYPVARDPLLRENQRCGVCGRVETLTKTHVPPRSAGNTGADVRRSHFVMAEGDPTVRAQDSRFLEGGMWVYGLCASCNGLAGKHDSDYAEACRSTARGHLGARYWFPSSQAVSPGRVARSVLMGTFALAPHLRDIEGRLAYQLQHDDPIISPPRRLHLYLARTMGMRGRVSGPVGWFMPTLSPAPVGHHWGANVAAQIWFPPLAWAFAVPDDINTYINALRWKDVTGWIPRPHEYRQPLSRLVDALPVVSHPQDTPSLADHAVELFNDQITHYLRCEMQIDVEDALR